MKLTRAQRYNSRVAVVPGGLSLFSIAIIGIVVAAVFSAATTAYGFLYADKIYPGISVLNTEIGGSTADVAKSFLLSRLRDLGGSEVMVRYGDRKWSITLDELGLRYDVDRMVAEGYDIGRGGNLIEQTAARIGALIRGRSASPMIWFDRATEERTLGAIAAEIERPARNAEIVVNPDGNIRINAAQSGFKVDLGETLRAFEASFSPLSTRELSLVVREIKPEVVENDLEKARTAGQTIVGRPLTLKADNRTWSIGEKELLRMLRFSPAPDVGAKATAQLDHAMLAQYLNPIAAEINRGAKDAALKYSGGKIVLIDGVDGLALDVEATVPAIAAKVAANEHAVSLVVKKITPAITESGLQEARSTAEKMIAEPLTLKHGDQTWTLSRADLGDMLVFQTFEAAGVRNVAPAFDEEDLTKFLNRIGQRIEKPAKDARFRFQNGQLSVISEGVDGLKLDVATTIASILTQTRQGGHTVGIATVAEKPKVQSSDRSKIVIKDRLVEATTSYAGSIPERAHNVELATSRLDGALIPPGETFSMNQALGPATLAAGFQIGYGIAMSGTEMITIPSEAGGICQVATTLYHAAFWAGLSIVERLEHLYWIPRYGQPPLGMKGLDATVDAPYVDFKFKNNTDNWLAIQTRTQGGNVHFSIYGTKTGWEVKVAGPKITNVVPADQEMVYIEDDTLPFGREIMVEQAIDGFVSTIVRTVYKDGKEIDKYTSVSKYRPSRNEIRVGTKGRPVQAE